MAAGIGRLRQLTSGARVPYGSPELAPSLGMRAMTLAILGMAGSRDAGSTSSTSPGVGRAMQATGEPALSSPVSKLGFWSDARVSRPQLGKSAQWGGSIPHVASDLNSL